MQTTQTNEPLELIVRPWIKCHECAHQSPLPSYHEGKHEHQNKFYAIGISSFNWQEVADAEDSGRPIIFVKVDRYGKELGRYETEEEAIKQKGEKL